MTGCPQQQSQLLWSLWKNTLKTKPTKSQTLRALSIYIQQEITSTVKEQLHLVQMDLNVLRSFKSNVVDKADLQYAFSRFLK